ncbi:MAG: lysylphosphatidylglycerol synthase transmembrane domain-containing protein, partial [Methylococcales bacterium]
MIKKFISWMIVLGITAFAFTYALWDIDFKELGKLLAGGDYRCVLPMLVLLFLFFWLKAIRWTIILRPLGDFSVFEVTPSMMIGFAGNNVLPGHLGEFVRTGIFSHRFSSPITSVFTTLVVERIMDVVAVFTLYEAGIALADSAPESLKVGAWFIAPVLVGLIAALGLMLFKPGIVHGIWDFFGRYLPDRFRKKGSAIIANVIHAFSSFRSLRSVCALIALSFLKWILMAGILWFSVYAYGQTMPFELSFIV